MKIQKAVEIIGNKYKIESSGGITEKNILKYTKWDKLYFCGRTYTFCKKL